MRHPFSGTRATERNKPYPGRRGLGNPFSFLLFSLKMGKILGVISRKHSVEVAMNYCEGSLLAIFCVIIFKYLLSHFSMTRIFHATQAWQYRHGW